VKKNLVALATPEVATLSFDQPTSTNPQPGQSLEKFFSDIAEQGRFQKLIRETSPS